MRVGVVRTLGSPCRCAESVSEGLRALNHEFFLVDSAEIDRHAAALAECDLVIDHTDTFGGRGLYRPMVRLLLENCGALVLGSSAESCFVADNKAASKQRLAAAGIPVPPGIVIRSPAESIPDWLKPPFILKPAFEHMSRGVRVAGTKDEACAGAVQLLASMRQPILIESYIPGRELAVSVINGSAGLQVLPVLEWCLGSGSSDILSEDFKILDAEDEKHRTLKAELAPDLYRELETLAKYAFHVLNLRDYARFDVRLTPGGTPFFLEANTTPSLEPMEALAVSAGWAGLGYAGLIELLIRSARSRFGFPQEPQVARIQLPTGLVELEVPEGVHFPPESTVDLAGLLDIREGEEALELGCGSGLLSIAMAKRGASRVVATDLDPKALEAASRNARRNGLADRIEVRGGSWYEAVTPGERFDVIVATPPQTPGPEPFGPRYGGPDGTLHLLRVIHGAPEYLKTGTGRLWLLAISLANPREMRKHLERGFAEASLVRETERRFAADEYEEMSKGLFEYLSALRSDGASDFTDAERGAYIFRNLFIRAAGPRTR